MIITLPATQHLPRQEVIIDFTIYPMSEYTAILIRDSVSGEPLMKATVAPNSGKSGNARLVGIKNYSENAGIEDSLKEAGIIQQLPVGFFKTGTETINLYYLTEWADKERQAQFEHKRITLKGAMR